MEKAPVNPHFEYMRRELHRAITRRLSEQLSAEQIYKAVENLIETQAQPAVVDFNKEVPDKTGFSIVEARLIRVSHLLLVRCRSLVDGLIGQKAPQRNCEFLLSLLLSKSEQEPAIGDFLERYEAKRKRLGKRRADIWAYSDVLRTIWPVVRRRITKLLKIVVAAEWLRRQFYQ